MINLEFSEEERASALAFLLAYKAFSDTGVFKDIYALVEFIKENLVFPGNLFRGQRLDWPIKSSGWRVEQEKRNQRYKKTLDFMRWLLNNPYLEAYHEPEIKLLAIAQHYSAEYDFVTDLIDFSTDYEVGAFFATYGDVTSESIGAVNAANIYVMDMAYRRMDIEGINILDIKGLWRIENQKGIFLKDINGDFEKYGLVIKLRFRQSPNVKYKTDRVNETTMFPEPNSLEREINRYWSLERRSQPMEVNNLFHVINVERDPLSIEAENVIPSVKWDSEESEQWRRIYAADFAGVPDLSEKQCFVQIGSDKCIVEPSEFGSLKTVLQELEEVKSSPFIPRISPRFHFQSPIIDIKKSEMLVNEYLRKYVASYFSLPFSAEEKCTTIKILILFAYYGGSTLQTVISPELDVVTQVFSTGNLTYCDFEDMQEIVSYAYIPNSFFDACDRMTTARELFNEHFKDTKHFVDLNSGEMIDTFLEHNFQLVQFLYTADKLFSFADIRAIWTSYVIPYQIAFRSESAVVVNPCYVSKIGLA